MMKNRDRRCITSRRGLSLLLVWLAVASLSALTVHELVFAAMSVSDAAQGGLHPDGNVVQRNKWTSCMRSDNRHGSLECLGGL